MPNPKRLYSLHAWLGLQLGLLLFIICFSGTIAVFTPEIDAWLDPVRQSPPPSAGTPKSPLSQSLLSAKQAHPHGLVRYVYRSEHPAHPDAAVVTYSREDLRDVFIDPYTGSVIGERPTLSLKSAVRIFHKQLYLVPTTIGFHGTFLVGATGLILLGSIATGILAFKNWPKTLVTLRVGKGRRLFLSDLHRLLGAWSLLAMLVIALTGVWYLIEKVSETTHLLEHDAAPPSLDAATLHALGAFPQRLPPDELLQSAQSAFPQLTPLALFPPSGAEDTFTIIGQAEAFAVRSRANAISLDPFTGDVVQMQRATELGLLDRLVHSMDPIHFGTFGGLLTRWIWFLSGLALSIGILAGAALYVTRMQKRAAPPGHKRRRFLWTFSGLATSVLLIGSLYSFLAYERHDLRPIPPPPALQPLATIDLEGTAATLYRQASPLGDPLPLVLRFPESIAPNPASLTIQYLSDGGIIEAKARLLADRFFAQLSLPAGDSIDPSKLFLSFAPSNNPDALPAEADAAPIDAPVSELPLRGEVPSATLTAIALFVLLTLAPTLLWLIFLKR